MLNNQSTQSTLSGSVLNGIQSTKQPCLCIKKYISKFACLNKKCLQMAFVCDNKSCDCRKEHQGCLLVEAQTFTNNILNKIISIQPLQNCINQNIDNIINTFSDTRDRLLLDVKSKFLHCGLNQSQIQYISLLNKGQFQSITGKLLCQTNLDIEPIISKQQLKNITIQYVSQEFNKINREAANAIPLIKNIQKIQSLIKKAVSYKKSKMKQSIDFNFKKITQAGSLFQLFQSKIISQLSEINDLKKILNFKNIKNIQLLYRASENQFQSKIFHKKCHKIENTLTLCETQFNKKIGGFTPLAWTENPSGQYKTDQSGKSFIFSFTHRQKFKLTQKQYAINDSISYGPIFGNGDDLRICNKANQNSSSYTNFNTSYQNSSYVKSDAASRQRFCGNPNNSHSFKVKQWQVWRIEFA